MVLSIAVGVFAVGTIATSQIMLSRDLRERYQATDPAHAMIMTFESFDEDLVKAVSNMREIREAEARRRVSLSASLAGWSAPSWPFRSADS